MNTDQAKTLLFLVEFEHSEIANEPHFARLKASLLALLVGEQATRRGTKFDRLNETFRRVPGQIQNKILVQICHIRHTALTGQAKYFYFALDPCVVGPPVHINLRHGNDFVSDSALLVVPMISFIRGPASLCAMKF